MSIASPFVDPDRWGIVRVSGTPIPGIIVDIDGVERPYEWVVQKALGTGGAVTIYRGENIAESIKVRTSLPNDAAFREADRFNVFITPKKGQKPAAFDIENAAFQWVGITKASIKVRPAPKGMPRRNWIVTYELIEYRKPVLIPMGQPDPAKIDGPPTPKDAAERAVVELIDKIERS